MPTQYTIIGTVTLADGTEPAGLKVQAFDRDLPSLERRLSGPQLLAEATTDRNGRFQIEYDIERFSRGDAPSPRGRWRELKADVTFRVFDVANREMRVTNVTGGNRDLGPNEVAYNVPAADEVTIIVEAVPQAEASEYERLLALLTPVLGDLFRADILDDDVAFLFHELQLDQQPETRQRIEWLRRCAVLAAQSGLSEDTFYGWGRKGLPEALDSLAARPLPGVSSILIELLDWSDEALDEALRAATAEKIIPTRARAGFVDIRARLQASLAKPGVADDETQFQAGAPDPRRPRVSGRLLDARTGAPLADYAVHLGLVGGGREEEDLGDAISDPEGRFDVVNARLGEVAGDGDRHVRLTILVRDGQQRERLKTGIEPEIDGEPIAILIPREDDTPVPSPVLNQLAASGGPNLPPWLSARFASRGIVTLKDVRAHGGALRQEGLPDAERGAAQLLDAHADLSRYSTDVRANAALIASRFGSTVSIADAPRDVFFERTRNFLGDLGAAELHTIARAERNVLRNVRTGIEADRANAYASDGALPAATAPDRPSKCACHQCETAASPLAYLTDLLDYTLDHVRQGGSPVTLTSMEALFHQPFADLPVACEAMDARIRQVRLCVEVLRRDVAGKALAPAAVSRLAAAESAYREAAYTALLGRFGTSYDELRLIRDAAPALRTSLAERLAFRPGAARPDRLDTMLLDPATVTEADLERLFGLIDTDMTRDRLSDGLVIGDALRQVTRWDLHGTEWPRHADAEGAIHVTIRQLGSGLVQLELYRDEARTALVAAGDRPDKIGPIALSARNDSGLTGTFDVRYQADSTAISLAAVPRLLAWRLAALRDEWEEQDHPATPAASPRPPNIDADLIGLADLRDPLTGDAANLWQARRKDIDDLLASISAARLAAATPSAALDAVLLHPQGLGQSAAAMAALDATRQTGANIRPQLAALGLDVAQFDLLVRLGQLVSTTPPSVVLQSEWTELDQLVTRLWKVRQAGMWRTQEAAAHITLGPDFFRLSELSLFAFPSDEPAPQTWLAKRDDRRAWERTLAAREDQQQSVLDGHRAAVEASEQGTIVALRDALIVAQDGAGTLSAAAKRGTDRLLIDCANGACQMTTRIAQAIETVQVLLLSIRTGQLRDTYPTLTLVAPDFDREWQWIGSYAPWRAAMLVWMYPENVLHPGLRDRQSPGFKRLVRDLRALPATSPDSACQLAKQYAQYFEDICWLAIEASARCMTRIYRGIGCRDRRPIEYRVLLHLIARRGGTVYWSTFDDKRPDPQSFWDWVPGFWQEEVLQVVGVSEYQIPGANAMLYVFAQAMRLGTQALLFTRFDLERGVWDTSNAALDLPQRGQPFDALVIPVNSSDPPRLTIRHPPGGGPGSLVYQRALNRDGNGWAEGEWFLQTFSRFSRIGAAEAQPGTTIAAAAPSAERLDLFTVARDGGVHHAWWGPPFNSGQWNAWARLDNAFSVPAGSPVTVHVRPTILELFVFGLGSDVQTRQGKITPTGLNWLPWNSVPGVVGINAPPLRPGITTVSPLPGRLILLTLDKNGTPFAVRREPDQTWSNWYALDSTGTPTFPSSTSVPAVVNTGNVHAFLLGPWQHGDVQEKMGEPPHLSGDWNAWNALPAKPIPLHSPVTAIARSDLDIDLFVVADDGSIQGFGLHKFAASSAHVRDPDWFRIGTLTVPKRSPVAALARGPQHLDLFVVGKDGRIHHASWDGQANEGSWTEWVPISAADQTFPARAPITAIQRRPGHIDLFVVGYNGGICSAWWDQDPNAQWPSKPFVVKPPWYKPNILASFEITEQLMEADLQKRRLEIRTAYLEKEPGLFPDPTELIYRRRILDYLDEAYYFVPTLLALQLQRDRHFVAALDWYRTTYDYSMPVSQREISFLFGLNKDWKHAYERAEDWLSDPLNPHAIAATRPRAYARFTILTLIRCFLEAGDDEYTRDTNESIPRARTYYLTALELADTPELVKQPTGCGTLVGEVHLELGEGHFEKVWYGYEKRLAAVNDRKALEVAVAKMKVLKAANLAVGDRLLRVREVVTEAEAAAGAQPRVAAVMASAAAAEREVHALLLMVPEIERSSRLAARRASDQVIAGVVAATGKSLATLREERPVLSWLGGLRDSVALERNQPGDALTAKDEVHLWYDYDIVAKWDEVYVPAPSHAFCVPANSVVEMLRLRAELNLYKLRRCRNIAGMERLLDPYAAPTDTATGVPFLTDGGQLVVPGMSGVRPTEYHYSVLVERAKQLAQTAAQMESSMLSAIEKRDAEAYTVLRARQDAELLRSQVRLQDLRITEAESGVRLAMLQEERTEIQLDHWSELLREDVNSIEQSGIDALFIASGLYAAAAASSFAAGGGISFSSIISFGSTNLKDAASAYSSLGQVASTASQILALQASYERRRQDWQYQRNLAQADVGIAAQSVTIAQNHLMINREERVIASLQADHASTGVEFLSNKFTNAELYDWMGNELEQVYRWFLRRATATASLAAVQLGFERQEVPPPFILADYWDAPLATDGQAPNRRGLTGSARLQQDMYQLDQLAFEKNARKLHLTKTISVGQTAPIELQRFRQTGVLPFVTTLEMFDRDFPGDYLRLLKQVRTSIIALIPPSQGIRATLSCTGTSRAVVGGSGGGPLQTVIVRRDPQRVALSAAMNATGVFELDPQPELMLPFEGLGVETAWELQMPRASNPFDFTTVADVLFTYEYTAFHSYEHGAQVMRQLGRDASYDRALSFNRELPDAWFALHNPGLGASAITVRFKTTRADFSPNLTELRIAQVSLYFALSDGPALTIKVDQLRFASNGVPAVGGGGSTTDGLISTRRGNASWSQLQGLNPVGNWELTMPNTPQTRGWFADQRITDIVMSLTYEGQLPPWPA
jgi:Tc toxin complex TcA C-terminal TcB-binding domain